MNTPCLDCEKRYPACHDHCKEYLMYYFKNELAKRRRFEYNEINRRNLRWVHAHDICNWRRATK